MMSPGGQAVNSTSQQAVVNELLNLPKTLVLDKCQCIKSTAGYVL